MGLIDSKARRDVIDAANARSLLLEGKLEEEYLLLLGHVRELELQREYLAFELSSDDDQADCNHSHLSCEHRKGWLCKAGLKGQVQCWLSEAEKFAKECLE
jgi:hypothetical protein